MPDTNRVAPLVSMIIPVYNSVTYLPETLDSMLMQGLSEPELEVIMIDDGSTDGSGTMMDEYAQRYPNFRVIHQPNSGGPGSPCNRGIDVSTGRYLFFLGSDDVLTQNALRELVDLAERADSDVVLPKMGSIGGRRPAMSMFKRTTYEADLVEDKIHNTLNALKLFRKELVDRLGIRFPTHLRIAEDQPFVASLYLHARRISVCAARDYVLIRTRDDGTNITSTRRSPIEYMDLVNELVPALVEGSDPGPRRDVFLSRLFPRELTKAVKTPFLRMDDEQQQQLVDDIRRTVGPVFNEDTAGYLDPLPRIKIELALEGDLDALRGVLAWEKAGGSARVVHDGTSFSYVLPDDLAAQVGKHRLHPPVVKADVTLTEVTCHSGAVELGITALALGSGTPAPEVDLRLKNRGTGREVDLPTAVERPVELASGSGNAVRVSVDLDAFPAGLWDVFVVQRFGGGEIVKRLGARKSEAVLAVPVHVFSGDDDRRPLGKLYFTRGVGNLSLDLGFTLTKNALPDASIRGVLQQRDESELVLVDVAGSSAMDFLVPAGGGSSQPVPVAHAKVGIGLFSVALPLHHPRAGPAHRLIIRSDDGERSVALPPALPVPAPATSGHHEKWRDTELSGDILRQALGDLRVVGRRTVRRAWQEASSLSRRVRGTIGRDQH